MANKKSLDPYKQIISALLSDAQALHSEVFTLRQVRLDIAKCLSRLDQEGISFLTKALPRLGKSFDKALLGTSPFDHTGFSNESGTKLPRFLGSLFKQIFRSDGWILPTPCVQSIATVRLILFVYYKYDLPYNESQESKVIDQFVKTEQDILSYDQTFGEISDLLDNNPHGYESVKPSHLARVIRRARVLLSKVFQGFDPYDITPRHGPGAVSTKEKLWAKYRFSRLNPRIDAHFPFDAYFKASLGHVCDTIQDFNNLEIADLPARVILVPKDSRGPRLISCEPLEFQWIQQGLSSSIVSLIERHPLTKYSVHFTDQQPNQFGALLGSIRGDYATLDLKEASDRVSVGLVRLLFPRHISDVLLACRSDSTILPSGQVLKLRKFAPMGSSLCFPIMALTIWSILAASSTDTNARESILVYGDDVIVPTAQAASAIAHLESFGLLINRDKSCAHGFFRESCGVDAYKGMNVTPVRIRTRWTRHPSPNVYESYIAYANAFRRRHFIRTSDLISSWLFSIYREIPSTDMNLSCPSLDEVPEANRPRRRRVNPNLQKLEYLVRCSVSRPISKEIDGWSMLLRYFAEAGRHQSSSWTNDRPRRCGVTDVWEESHTPFSVRLYTRRDASFLAFRWR